ncbi:hypothetical protein GCM10009674_07420 [Nesterenkonia xinjiangensis]
MTDRSPESTTWAASPAVERPEQHSEETVSAPSPAESDDSPRAEAPESAETPAVPESAEDAELGEVTGPLAEVDPADGEAPDDDDAESEQSSTHPTTESIRLSHATPVLPPESRPEAKDTTLSDFFDTLDARVAEATGRLAGAFRRPEPGEQVSARVDTWPVRDHTEEPEEAPQGQGDAWEDGSSWEEESISAHDDATSYPADLPAHLEEDLADDVDLPDAESASQLDAYQQQDHAPLSLPTADIDPEEDATMVTLPPIDAQTGDPRTSRIALPRPPSGDGRPLPWEVREQQAEQARLQDASAARRRAVILEKASAIEAATGHEDPDSEEFADEEEDLYTYIPPYNLPSRDPDPVPRGQDMARQIFVTIGALAAVTSALWMLGLFTGPAIIGGNGLESLVDGWYSGNRALLTPDAGHYWLWPVIALCLVGHAVYQWTTTQISTPRQRRSGWLVGLASILMLMWTAAVHAGMMTAAVLAALAAALALVDAVRQFTLHTARNAVERRLTDAVVGLFAGWALVGAMSSVSAMLTMMGVRIPGFPAILWAMIGLVACIWVGAFYAMTERGRMTIALGLGWGMFWLIFPRLLSETPSVWVAIGAAMGAFIVILATESRRHRINHAERRAAMGRPVDDII